MGLDSLGKNVKQSLQAATIVGGVLAGTPAHAQESQENQTIENTEATKEMLKIDDFVAATEGTSEERQKLAAELYAHVFEQAEAQEDMSKEMLFPLRIGSRQLSVRVLLFPEIREMRIVVFEGKDALIYLADEGITGTPIENQMMIEEKNIPRPQGFVVRTEHALANRLYLGLLRQLLSDK